MCRIMSRNDGQQTFSLREKRIADSLLVILSTMKANKLKIHKVIIAVADVLSKPNRGEIENVVSVLRGFDVCSEPGTDSVSILPISSSASTSSSLLNKSTTSNVLSKNVSESGPATSSVSVEEQEGAKIFKMFAYTPEDLRKLRLMETQQMSLQAFIRSSKVSPLDLRSK